MYPLLSAPAAGAVLRALRTSRGLTQTELGRRLGVTKARISAIERDPSGVALGQILAVVAALGGRVLIDDAHGPRDAAPLDTW
jgi:transcriptional regulator with XRE-family HTH domain